MKEINYEQAYVFALQAQEMIEYIDKKEKEESWFKELKQRGGQTR